MRRHQRQRGGAREEQTKGKRERRGLDRIGGWQLNSSINRANNGATSECGKDIALSPFGGSCAETAR